MIAILVGIIGALAGVYFREALRNANAKLKAAVFLESNLRYWLKAGLESDEFQGFLVAGYSLSEERRKAIQSGNLDELSKFNKEFEDKLSSLKKDPVWLKKGLQEALKKMTSYKKEELNEIIKEIDRRINSLENGDGLVRTSDLAYLDWFKVPDILAIKSQLIDILVSLKLFVTHVSVRENVDEDLVINMIMSCVENGLKASMYLVPLLKYAQSIRSKGIWRNIT